MHYADIFLKSYFGRIISGNHCGLAVLTIMITVKPLIAAAQIRLPLKI